jgi:hypothetical protein
MNKWWIVGVLATELSSPAYAQRVEIQKSDQGHVVHVQTALNHLTILEFSEPVLTVAVGSPVFKVEWRQNKVFIEPTDENVATNLFVWTGSNRFNYELDPAGAVPEMVFAIDQPPAPPAMPVPPKKPDPPSASPAEVLASTKPVYMHGAISGKKRIGVYLENIYQHDGQLFIAYVIRNETVKAYRPGVPQLVALASPRYHDSLYLLPYSQLSPREAARLKANGETSVAFTQISSGVSQIGPGEEAAGIVAIKAPDPNGSPCVLRLTFFPAATLPVTATLVL